MQDPAKLVYFVAFSDKTQNNAFLRK